MSFMNSFVHDFSCRCSLYLSPSDFETLSHTDGSDSLKNYRRKLRNPSFSGLTGAEKKDGDRPLGRDCCDKMRGDGLKLKEEDLD